MALMVTPRTLPRCARCGGQMYVGYEREQTCLWCGEVLYPPPAPLNGDEDLETWRRRLRGKPGRPPRRPAPDRDACA